MATDDRETEPREADAPGTAEVDVTRVAPAKFRVAASAVTSHGSAARYERGRELGRGGLGRVSAALDRTLQRQVAIKELHQRSEGGVRRFIRESLTTARLQHPAIVPVLDAGTWGAGDPYLVMKLLEGKTLSEELRTRTTTEARLALLPNLLTVADALGYAHEQGVVHRDVKPSNVMLGTHGETVLLDWGIAHDASAIELEIDGLGRGPEPTRSTSAEPLTVAGALAGTVRYMSPEQARGEPPTPAFDVYSLGVTLAAVLGGQRPYGDLDHDAIFARLRAGELSVPTLPADTPADLAAIIAKATAASADRYAHAGQLADDLRKFIAGQLVTARRYSTRELVARWIRRHGLLLAISGTAAAAIVVVAIVAVSQVVHERNLAIAEREAAVARAQELILLQARASLRTDPTATIAWLKDYPETAPYQDEVRAMIDEAAGRGVARHVWHAGSAPNDVQFAGDAVVSAHGDGELLRADLATGARRQLAKFPTSLLFARPQGDAIAVLDQDGGVSRWTDAGVTLVARLDLASRPTGLYLAGGDLKITFVEGAARYVSRPPASEPGGFAFTDDETDATAVYAVSAAGELSIVDPTPRRLASFAPRTWVRGSDDGKTYAAIEPSGPQRMTVWIGSSAGSPPIEVGTTRACAPGDNLEQSSEVADDGSVVAIQRCGALLAFTPGRALAIDDPERVGPFELSPDARWLALGRSSGLELLDIRTGAARELVGGSAITRVRFSPDGKWLVTVDVEQGTRVWPVEPATTAGRLDDHLAPTRLFATRDGELAIRRHLGCARWSTAELRIASSFGVREGAIRDLDDEPGLWAWDGSDDGRTCTFAGRDGRALVVGDVTQTLVDAHALDACVLTSDATAATCRTDDGALVSFDVASGAHTATRRPDGAIRGVVRYRRTLLVLIARPTGCALEKVSGELVASLPPGCQGVRASGPRLGSEAALVIARTGAVDVWTDLGGALAVPTEHGIVEVSRELGLVAVAHDRAIEIWDLRTHAHREVAAGHALAIGLLAWSATGMLASADDETVRVWNPTTEQTRVIYAPHLLALVWSPDGRSLLASDGKVVESLAVPTIPRRLDELTTARIIDGRVETP